MKPGDAKLTPDVRKYHLARARLENSGMLHDKTLPHRPALVRPCSGRGGRIMSGCRLLLPRTAAAMGEAATVVVVVGTAIAAAEETTAAGGAMTAAAAAAGIMAATGVAGAVTAAAGAAAMTGLATTAAATADVAEGVDGGMPTCRAGTAGAAPPPSRPVTRSRTAGHCR